MGFPCIIMGKKSWNGLGGDKIQPEQDQLHHQQEIPLKSLDLGGLDWKFTWILANPWIQVLGLEIASSQKFNSQKSLPSPSQLPRSHLPAPVGSGIPRLQQGDFPVSSGIFPFFSRFSPIFPIIPQAAWSACGC